jgi:protein-L-isoaspartate(D-aspartate) O-methyltransferase
MTVGVWMDSTAAREAFAARIEREAGLESAALVRALATVPREDFVGAGPWKIMRPAELGKGYVLTPDADPVHLYDTVVVALDAARKLNNGEPSSLLGWLDRLGLTPGTRFLHIGCGVGYYTAIAAVAVGPEGRVVGVEVDAALAARAERNLAAYPNASALCGDGSEQAFGTFDAIFVNAGCTHPVPIWLDALAPGGRLLLPLTVPWPGMPNIGGGSMLLVARRDDRYAARFTGPVGIFHCQGARTEAASELLAQSLARGDRQTVRWLRRDAHAPA